MTASEFIVIDFGVAWTKAFHLATDVDLNTPQLVIKSRAIVPTSVPDLEVSYKELLNSFPQAKKAKVILTSSFCKKEAIETFSSNTFIDNDEVYKTLHTFFGQSSFDVMFLDGGASNFLQTFEPTKVSSLTTDAVTEIEIENYLGNKRRFLFALPTQKDDQDIELAFLKNYLLTRGLVQGEKSTLVIASGGLLSHSKNTKLVLELLCDRLTLPFCQVLLDTTGVLPCFGALMCTQMGKKDILQVPSLISLMSLVNLGGPATVSFDFGFSEIQKVHVGIDELVVLPAERDKEVIVRGIGKQELKTYLTAGLAGVVVDGRVKPLDLVPKSDLSKEKIKKWREALSIGGAL